MKVLEVGYFMTWAENYGSGFEVQRCAWRGRGMSPSDWPGPWESIRELRTVLSSCRPGDFDAIVCAALGRSYRERGLQRWSKYFYETIIAKLVCAIASKCRAPLAVIDISDDLTIHPVNVTLIRGAGIYFKRELPLDPYHALDSMRLSKARTVAIGFRRDEEVNTLMQKLEPISLGCRESEPVVESVPVPEKKWDLFYAGTAEAKPRRDGITEALEQLSREGIKVHFPQDRLTFDEYIEALRQSRLALSPPGLGWDCHRHYEAALAGTAPVLPFPTIKRQHPLLDGEHCFFYDPEKNLADQVRRMLGQPERLERVSLASKNWVEKNHTHEARYRWVVEQAAGQGQQAD